MRILASFGQADHVIGGAGITPWSIPDVKTQVFDEVKDQIAVMGRRSWDLFGSELPCFQAVVLSRSFDDLANTPKNMRIVPDLGVALKFASELDPDREVLVVGGASVFRQALPLAQGMVLAVVKSPQPGDLLFPDFSDREWWIEDTLEHPSFELLRYARRDVA